MPLILSLLIRQIVAIEFYDPKDPGRFHIMPKGVSARGSAMWLALDVLNWQEHWDMKIIGKAIVACNAPFVTATAHRLKSRAMTKETADM